MKVLVTGGAGFIGSHVAEKLLREGYDVIIVDNLSTGNRANIDELLAEGARFIQGGVVGLPHILPTDVPRVDAIVHLGQPSSSPMYWKYPELFHKTIQEMQAVLDMAYSFACPVIFASSSSVYAGNFTPWHERMEIIPHDRYSEVKYICERMGFLWARRQQIKFIALRLFSVFGEREEYKGRYANLLTQIIWSGLSGEQLEIFGDGSQTRDLVYVKDVADAFHRALEYVFDQRPGYADVFNVGNGQAYSIRDMVDLVERAGLRPKIKYLNYWPDFYIFHTQADTEKARKVLKWWATRRVEDVVPRLVEYYATRMEFLERWSGSPP